MKYLKLMRIKHYLKNLLIFIPLFFSGSAYNASAFINAIWAFLAFCLISSAVYIVNDIQDADKDRQHPVKKYRPIASGAVSIRNAYILFGLCIIGSFAFNLLTKDAVAGWCLVIYLIINICYSRGLKNVPIVDIVILVSGFVIRMLYGALVTDITISGWLYLTVIAGSTYLGLGKRRNELKRIQKDNTRKVLKYYNQSFLDMNMSIYLCLTIAFYSLWAVDKNSTLILLTVPAVMVIFMKYSLDINGDSDGDPVEVVYHDKALLIMIALFALYFVLIMYAL